MDTNILVYCYILNKNYNNPYFFMLSETFVYELYIYGENGHILSSLKSPNGKLPAISIKFVWRYNLDSKMNVIFLCMHVTFWTWSHLYFVLLTSVTCCIECYGSKCFKVSILTFCVWCNMDTNVSMSCYMFNRNCNCLLFYFILYKCVWIVFLG